MQHIETRVYCSILLLALVHSPLSVAQGLLDWQRTNIQLLHGNTYELGPAQRTVVTFEHADGYKYGDNYLFFDYTERTDSTYGEWRTRLSLTKITGKDLAFGPISDVLIAAQFEFPSEFKHRDAFGVGLVWDIPGFQFLGTNFLSRDDPKFDGRAILMVLNWGTTWDWGAPIRFEGYCDFQAAETDRGSWVNCAPRLLLDVGHFSGQDGHFFVGIKYQYWSDKFGADITDEQVAQAMLKLVF